MTFSNVWEQDAPFPLIAWHHLTDFKSTMDGNGLANLVDAFGQPAEDGTPLIETYWPGGTFVNMPRYDAAPTFDTVSDSSTLFDHAVGYRNDHADLAGNIQLRSEAHTSESQSLMRISYAVCCLHKKN